MYFSFGNIFHTILKIKLKKMYQWYLHHNLHIVIETRINMIEILVNKKIFQLWCKNQPYTLTVPF